MMHPRPLAPSIVALTIAVFTGAPAVRAADLAARIDAWAAPAVAARQLSGNLVVARGGDVVYERSFGMADYDHDVPVTPDTRFCVASITKSMTLVVAIRLIEEGVVGMNDPVEKWIPGFPRGDRITFLHLLRHRAGLPHRVTTPEEEARPISSAQMVERVIRRVKRDGFLCEPGEKSIYSSAGYSVVARVCELATGEAFAALLQRYVFDPAGMAHSFDPSQRTLLPPHAMSYTDTWPGVRKAERKDYAFLVGAGSVFSTARDVVLFMRAVVDTVYGAGVRASMVRDGGMHENGITNGYRAFADYDEASDVTVVFTGNRHTGAVEWLRRDIPRIVAGEDIPPPEIPRVHKVTLTDDQLRAFGGSWTSQRGADFDVTVKDGLVYCGWYALIPTSPTTFFSPQDYADVTFTVENGRATRIEWQTDAEPLVWTRVE